MPNDPDISIFMEHSAKWMNVNALGAHWEAEFANGVAHLKSEAVKDSFRRGFAKSINGQLTLRQFEDVTDWDFDTPEELHEHLIGLWRKFYGDADPADSLAWPTST